MNSLFKAFLALSNAPIWLSPVINVAFHVRLEAALLEDCNGPVPTWAKAASDPCLIRNNVKNETTVVKRIVFENRGNARKISMGRPARDPSVDGFNGRHRARQTSGKTLETQISKLCGTRIYRTAFFRRELRQVMGNLNE